MVQGMTPTERKLKLFKVLQYTCFTMGGLCMTISLFHHFRVDKWLFSSLPLLFLGMVFGGLATNTPTDDKRLAEERAGLRSGPH
jgi:hypothetical protein